MPDLPLVITVEDAKNPTLLVRVLRAIADQLTALGVKIEALASSVKAPSFDKVRSSLQADGATPLNITNLRGITADPQPSGATRYAAIPTGLVLQTLRDTQLILVTNGASYDIYTVIGGSPNTLKGPL